MYKTTSTKKNRYGNFLIHTSLWYFTSNLQSLVKVYIIMFSLHLRLPLPLHCLRKLQIVVIHVKSKWVANKKNGNHTFIILFVDSKSKRARTAVFGCLRGSAPNAVGGDEIRPVGHRKRIKCDLVSVCSICLGPDLCRLM